MQLALPVVCAGGDGPAGPSVREGLLATLLREQQSTAVERFARQHSNNAAPALERYYRDLIPLTLPQPGEQYAFEVDLDACSGCKACVAACHSLNGLEEDETWRSVGLLTGGTSQLPVIQHVTTACHHCLEPACLEGCPVEAYEKDPLTGIVRHLDDQCFGCQYCILKCPYDVPRYSRSKGIVRKCDMCRDRLAVGEAPACVQSCPNQAIRITLVNQQQTAEDAEANLFLPGAPEPGYTLPTTVYKTNRPLPANLLPADYYAAAPQHAHWPLVWMLVLTQMSVGAFVVEQAVHAGGAIHAAAALVLGMVGLGAAVLHLGRPWLAYRAIIGWRTSWLSREVLAFSAFALLASLYAAIPWLANAGWQVSSAAVERGLGLLVAASGLAGVLCSVMIYASTRRVLWNPFYTGAKFLLSCLVLGIPVALLIQLASSGETVAVVGNSGRSLAIGLIAAAATKLLIEAAIFGWLHARTFTPLRRTALLMTGELARPTLWRFTLGAAGGIVLPAVLLTVHLPTDGSISGWLLIALAAGLMLALCLAGEVLERYLFFAAVVVPKMPGAPAA
jgi:formate dehydrogenase iron-sulfur subunit